MRRYKKQQPKIDIKPKKVICHNEAGGIFSVTIRGLNRAGKKSVRAMDEHIQEEKARLSQNCQNK